MTAGLLCLETGNFIAFFDDADEAKSALERIVQDEPNAADELAVAVFDDDGLCVSGYVLPPPRPPTITGPSR